MNTIQKTTFTELMPGDKIRVRRAGVVSPGHGGEKGCRLVGEGHVVCVEDAQRRLVFAVRKSGKCHFKY